MLELPQLEIPFADTKVARTFRGLPWWENRERQKSCRCSECGQPTNTYHRTISAGLGWKLVRLVRLDSGSPGEFFHVSQFDVLGGRGESGILGHWGLVEERANGDGRKKTSGFWRLTEFGKSFVMMEERLPKYAIVRQRNALLGFSGPAVFLREVLRKENGFDYAALMESPLPELRAAVR